MKVLVLNPDFGVSAQLMDNRLRLFNHCIVIQKMLKIFEQQKDNDFESVPNYRLWHPYQNAFKCLFNAYLKVCKEVHHVNTKYQYYEDIPEDIEYPPFTDATFKSHQAFLINLDKELYLPKFEDSKGFNGGKLIWEFLIHDENNNPILVGEDFNGRKNILKSFPDVKSYDLKEINKKYTKLKN